MSPRTILAYLLGLAGLGAILVAGIVLFFGAHDNPSPESVEVTTSEAPLAVPSSSDDPYGEGVSGPCERDVEILRQRSKQLISAWVKLTPEDSTTSRRERVAPFVLDSFFDRHGMEVYPELPAEQARQESGLTRKGEVTAAPIQVICPFNGQPESTTTVEYNTWYEGEGGVTENTQTSIADVHWRFIEDSWRSDDLEVRPT